MLQLPRADPWPLRLRGGGQTLGVEPEWAKVLVVVAEALNEHLPAGCFVRAENSGLAFYDADGGWWGTQSVGWGDPAVPEQLQTAVEILLSSVQDHVAHATGGMAWPDDPNYPDPLPAGWARVGRGHLLMGYGVHAFEPIPLEVLARRV